MWGIGVRFGLQQVCTLTPGLTGTHTHTLCRDWKLKRWKQIFKDVLFWSKKQNVIFFFFLCRGILMVNRVCSSSSSVRCTYTLLTSLLCVCLWRCRGRNPVDPCSRKSVMCVSSALSVDSQTSFCICALVLLRGSYWFLSGVFPKGAASAGTLFLLCARLHWRKGKQIDPSVSCKRLNTFTRSQGFGG